MVQDARVLLECSCDGTRMVLSLSRRVTGTHLGAGSVLGEPTAGMGWSLTKPAVLSFGFAQDRFWLPVELSHLG